MKGLRPDVPDEDEGMYPLHLAVLIGQPEAVLMLLAFGADPNTTCAKSSQTALHVATEGGQLELLQASLPHYALIFLQETL